MSRPAALPLAATICLALCGCGDGKRPETSTAADGGADASARGISDDRGSPADTGPPLDLYCDAGLSAAVGDCVEAFAASTGIRVIADYAGAGTLLSRIHGSARCDLYLAASLHYVEEARRLDRVRSHQPVGYLVPVIVVRKGCPKQVQALADLAQPGLKLGLGDPKTCAIGKITQDLLAKNDLAREKIERNLAFVALSVGELGEQLRAGRIDAAIVWDATAAALAGAGNVVRIPRERNVVSTAAVAVLRSSTRLEAAQRFVDFLASEEGRAILARHHIAAEPPAP
ncbi:MAG: molybdate ABC transporter substrate-binding protein [bacterium]